jgi:hypothetical protein
MYKAKDWGSFQSYKDRNPPWIRLHKRLIDDINFQRMSADARALLPMIWLLISEDKDPVSGMLRIGYEEITFRLRQPEKIVRAALSEIVRAGFLEEININKSDSYENVTNLLRNCHSETETETDSETYCFGDSKKEKPEKAKTLKNYFKGDDFDIPQDWGDMAYEDGLSPEQINWHWTKFKNYWLSTGTSKGRKLNWKRTWQNWYMQEIEKNKRKQEINELYTRK